MTDKKQASFAKALRENDAMSSGDYAAHRDMLAKKIHRLRQREKLARRLLIGLGIAAISSLLVVMGLERLPRTFTSTEPMRTISDSMNVIFAISWMAFPLLLSIYLFRHLPNWWISSQSRQEWLLQEIADSKQQRESSPPQSTDVRPNDVSSPDSRAL